MPGNIYKSGRKERFTTLYNSMLEDKRLSFKAKGLFAVMMSRPADWEFSVSGLAAYTGSSKDAVRSGLLELERVGYLIREQQHSCGGKFGGNIFILQDVAPPLSENTVNGEIRQRKTPSSDFQTQQSTDLTNTPLIPQGGAVPSGNLRQKQSTINAKWKPERFEAFWKFYRTHARGENRGKAVRAWDKLKPSDELIEIMGHALKKQIASEDWQRGIGIPHAATWLNNSRWEDVPGGDAPDGNVQPRYVRTVIVDGREVDVYE